MDTVWRSQSKEADILCSVHLRLAIFLYSLVFSKEMRLF